MKIGKVISIEHDKFKIKLSSEITTNSLNISGEIYYFGNIGGYVKIKNSLNEWIICEIISIFSNDYNIKNQYDALHNREIIAKPIGSISPKNNTFQLGISIFPSIYSNVEIIAFEDMNHILSTACNTNDNKNNNNKQEHSQINIGISKNLINYPVNISIDKLFNIHSAILGNSGSGKSSTISTILQSIIEKKDFSAKGAKIIIFDVNGEYINAIENKGDGIKIQYLKPNIPNNTKNPTKPFYLPHFLLSLDEWAAFLLATEATQKPFWEKVLKESYRFHKQNENNADENKDFENYIKCRITLLVTGALEVADTDTAVVTTIRNLLHRIKSILDNSKYPNINTFINNFLSKCKIEFGKNNESIQNHISSILNGNKIINIDKYNDFKNQKIEYDSYFSVEFIKIAVDWILLEEESKGNKRIREHTSTMITRLEHFMENDECSFMRNGMENDECSFMRNGNEIESQDNFKNQLFKDNQITIIDTSELSPYSLETLTSVTSRILFDMQKKLSNRSEEPIHLILDEAHRYIKKDTKFMITENIFEKISREGRKYAFYLIVSSQRPSELSETVLSQCGNFIIHRIQNQVDMNFIANIMPFFSDDFKNKIKLSVPGEALIFGNCVPMPLQVKVNEPSPKPKSENCNIPKKWFKEEATEGS